MGNTRLTKESLKSLAALVGLELSAKHIDHLLPQMQASMEAQERLRSLDLEGIEPDLTFSPAQE